ncbi:hypothetical protein EV2_006627 [Malus domestica]
MEEEGRRDEGAELQIFLPRRGTAELVYQIDRSLFPCFRTKIRARARASSSQSRPFITSNHSEYTIDIYQMGKPNPDEKILSYNDVVLRRSDLDILSGPYFLNDRLIEFYFSYLSSCSEEILLIPPSIAFWMMNAVGQGLHEFLVPLNLPDKKLVIFPVNDNEDVSEAGGGSHWSLLAFERDSNVFVHHDSNGGMNRRHAKKLYDAVVDFMSVSSSATKPTYQECSDSPQQVNGYDCGLYVLAIARVICSWYGSKDKGEQTLWFHAVREQVTPSVVAAMRNVILELIRGLMPVK